MTFGAMIDRTRMKLNEATAAFYSDDDIKLALNEGYAEMADATEFYERQAYVPMLTKRTYYDLSLILPDTFLSPRRVYNPRTSNWLEPTDPVNLDLHMFPQWELTEGEPEQYIMRGNWWFGVFPKPTQDGVGLRFYYSAIPPAMSGATDTPEFPEEFHEGLIEFALSDLKGQRRETAKALSHWQRYIAFQEGLKAYADGRTRLAQRSVL